MKQAFGIDVGGTGIKGGIVDVEKGRMLSERRKYATPKPATPEAVAAKCRELVQSFDWSGPIGCGFPSIVQHNICKSATNIDPSWVGVNIAQLIQDATDCPTCVVNDADAAAICEYAFGNGRLDVGLMMMVTIGTGIGCGMIYNGDLIPNCELGVTYLSNGIMLEKYCSNAARVSENLDMVSFGKRLNEALLHIDRLTSPDLIILGGGASKDFALFQEYLDPTLNVRPAAFHNASGTIGAAYHAARCAEGCV